jgi:phosphoribosylanthranilate isomerase
MTAEKRYIVLAVLALAVIGGLGFFVSNPVLYSLEQSVFSSRFHDNIEALTQQTWNSTTDVLPLEQDLIGYSGPVVLNIRIHDIDDARRDLELFSQSNLRLDGLIVTLDMNQSEIQELSQSSAQQRELLQSLLNSSISLNALQDLEIQYRDQNNQGGLVAVQLQGDALRKKIASLYTQYQAETKIITEISEKQGLDVSSQEESLKEFDAYVKDINASQAEPAQRQVTVPIYTSAQLSFMSYPGTGMYGDSIACSGYFFTMFGYLSYGTPGEQVTVYLDNTPVSSVTTDAIGSFDLQVPIDRIPAGTHSLHAESGLTRSDSRSLTVAPVGSVTNLTVSNATPGGDVSCTGSVIANKPVSFAPVELIWDGSHMTGTTTDANGGFSTTLRLPNGPHTVVARFSGEGYPIHPSESMPQVVDVSIQYLPILPTLPLLLIVTILLVAGIVTLSAGGAWYYLRRMSGRRGPGSPAAPSPGMTEPAGSPEAALTDSVSFLGERPGGPAGAGTVPESLFARYAHILQDGDLSAAARVVYLGLSERIAQDLHIQRHTSLTPRELSQACTKKPYCGPFSSFVHVYERVRYGGCRSATVQTEFEAGMKDTATLLEGEDH